MSPASELRVFGVRHHGPGCARALRLALEAFQPDEVLIEGPPEADKLIPLAARATPPVALVVYDPDAPREAAFFPFAEHSPEWQAIQWCLREGRSARFIDLPQAARAGLGPEPPGGPRDAPFAELAAAAGFPDHALWWEHQIEQRRDVSGLFEGILEAMAALREDALTPASRREALREAWMRRQVRKSQRAHGRVAVVCGAWHAPALLHPFTAKHDDALLKGLARGKRAVTWAPWTQRRLAARSGYGAGVAAPGWYEHLWDFPEGGGARWVSRAAGALREAGYEVSAAHVIAATRLADTLAALRGYSTPGRAELNDAIQATLCEGREGPMALLSEALDVGQRMGQVPPDTPTLPLQRDLEVQRKRLRLRQRSITTELHLDLREPRDRDKSELLHRLNALSVPWGKLRPEEGRARTTSGETWELRWDVDYDLRLIEASVWGNAVDAAASAALSACAAAATDLAELTALLDQAALAALPKAARRVLQALRDQAARSDDVLRLMSALGPLIRVRRYGDARATPPEELDALIEGLVERVLIGLPRACAALDAEAAAAVVQSLSSLDEGLILLGRPPMLEAWREVLRSMAETEGLAGGVRGRATRALLEAGVLPEDALSRLAALALSPTRPADDAAAWLEGAVSGSGLALLHQASLWSCLDGWLSALNPQDFIALLPVVRRSFSGFSPAERRLMGERVRSLGAPGRAPAPPPLHPERAALVLPLLRQLLEGTHV